MSEYEVIAEARTETGKGAMRRLRAAGPVPGVIYGAGKDPANISVKGSDLRKQLENEAFFSHILTVAVGAKKEQAVLKALQRSPANLDVVHVDFLRVSARDAITMRVPLHFANEDSAPGRKAGGAFSHLMNDVEISCLPADLPEYIDVDVAAMDVGDSLHLSQLALPDGVSLTVDVSDPDHDHTVVTLTVPHALDLGEEAEAGEEEGSREVPTVAEDKESGAEQD